MKEQSPAPRARSFWSGTISFGLVSIPVDLYPAHRPTRTGLRMLDADGTPLRRQFFDADDRPVDGDALVRGFEIDRDEFVVVTDDELESLEPRKSRDIDLRLFVDADALEPLWFERAYFLTPSGESNKAYRLLAATMERTGKAGIATFVMRTKEYLVAIFAENGILRAETLRFHDEVRTPADVGLPAPVDAPAAEVKRIRRAVAERTGSELDTAELSDTYAAALAKLVEKKRRAGAGAAGPKSGARAREDADEDDGIIDLMEVLKRSMRSGEAPARGRARAARAAPRNAARSGSRSAGARKAATKRGRRGKSDLARLTKAELYARAQELDIPGRSGMNRDALARAVAAAE